MKAAEIYLVKIDYLITDKFRKVLLILLLYIFINSKRNTRNSNSDGKNRWMRIIYLYV